MNSMPSSSSAVVAALALVLSASHLLGQAESGTVVGTVTDQAGAVVPGATITLTHEATQFSRSVTTNSNGQYFANAFPTGSVTAIVEQPGFERLVRRGVQLTTADTVTLDLRLTVGSVHETVEVTGQAPVLQSQTAAVSTLVTNKEILETPLNGRSFTQLLPLTTGASPSSPVMTAAVGAYSGQRTNVNVSVNGSVSNNNSYLIDGIVDRDMWVNYLVIVPTVDSIQEVRVLASNYSAEYGAAAGAVTVVQTKSGTNEYHGDLYEFLRNDKMDANTFFNNAGGVARPAFRRNEFGGIIGGPVRHDKTFIFGDYQGTRIVQPTTVVSTLPTADQARAIETGNFSTLSTPIYNPYAVSTVNGQQTRAPFAGNRIPTQYLDPIAVKLQTLVPLPNAPGTTRNFTFNPANRENDNQFDIRVDQNLSGSDRLFFKYSRLNTYGLNAGTLPSAPNPIIPVGPYLSGGLVTNLGNWSATANYVKVIGATTVNEVRIGVVRPRYDDTLTNGWDQPLAAQLGIPGINISDRTTGLPTYTLTGFNTIGNAGQFPDSNHTTSYQYEDVLSLVKGSHSLKFGGRFIRHDFNGYTVQAARGQYSFNGQFTRQIGSTTGGSVLADFALGAANGITRSVQTGVFGARMWETGFFVDDTWRATNRLTLTFGLRHEMQSPPYEVNNRWANFNLSTGIFDVAGVNGASRSLVRLDTNNFAPRLGIAYVLTKDNKTVLRTGGGIFYVESWNMGKELHQNPPMTLGQTITTDQNGPPPLTIAAGLPLPTNPSLTNPSTLNTGYVLAYDPGMRLAKSMQWSFGIQRELMSSLLLDVSYVGTRTLDMINALNANQPLPGPGGFDPRRPFYPRNPLLGDVDYRSNWGAAKYHSLQVTLRRQYSKNFTGGLAYTWSHNLTNTRGPAFTSRPQNSYCSACEWGNAPEDRRHMLVINHVYQLPFGAGQKYLSTGFLGGVFGGWRLSGVWSIYSGQPFSPSLATATSNTTTTSGNVTATERPNVLSNPNLPNDQRTIDRWFNVQAFGIPAQYTFGNAGTYTLQGPGFFNVDLGLHRDFRIRESWRLTYRWETFNSFNNTRFNNPNATIGTATAGVITSTLPARVMQMAMKLTF